jgi:hypothetical protein
VVGRSRTRGAALGGTDVVSPAPKLAAQTLRTSGRSVLKDASGSAQGKKPRGERDVIWPTMRPGRRRSGGVSPSLPRASDRI